MSQFAFLSAEFPEVFAHASKAESQALGDPRAACFYARLALEVGITWLYGHDGSLRDPYENTLAARIHEASFRRLVGENIVTKSRIIKDYGNAAVHETRAVAPANAIAAVRELFHFAYWLTRNYARGPKPAPNLAFSPQALPRTAQVTTASLKQLQEAARKFEESSQALADAEQKRLASETQRAALEAELVALRAEVAAAKAANAATPDTHDYNEEATCDTFIDLLLQEAGWPLANAEDREFPVMGMPNNTGEGFVDYVLWGDDHKPLGLVEAKRTRRDARVGQQQAKLYADCLEKQFGQRPLIFYTNGYEHWLWDDTRYSPRSIQGFLTKDELQLAIQRRSTLKPLAGENIDPAIVERFYQTRAIRRVSEAIEKDHQRRALLVMATGAGKTRTVIALSDLLMRANWAKRVLFLADRVALVRQAVNAFKKHLPSSSPVNLVSEKDGQGRVYVSTYPTMMNLIDETANGKRLFGVGHFDLIVIDEAHRSVYRKYGAIFDYFDSLLVGLTATPKDEVDRDTYRLFDLQRGVPTDAYGLDEAVKDGYLVPPRAVSVPLKFIRQGVRYDDLSEDEKEQWDAIEWDEDGNVPRQIDPPSINKWLFNADTVDKVLEHLTNGQKVAAGDRLGKTIIFAKNHDHAQFIAQRFDTNYPHLKGVFARVIDFKTEYAQSILDDFCQSEKSPHIAISVDMLDTGIDVPEVVNLVFFKIVRSKTKFWQMLGRGTRLCPDLFGPGRHKEFFYVFDFCQNFEFFNQNPKAADGAVVDSLTKRLFVQRIELIGELQKIEAQEEVAQILRGETASRLHQEVAAMSLDNFIVRPKRLFVEMYADKAAWENLTLDDQHDLAREVAGLPSGFTDDDIDAKQFDLLILRTQLALLRADHSFSGLKKKISETASLLEELSNVPMVAAELSLILELQTDEYWQDVTAPMLETVRRRLRALIKLIELKRRAIIYSDFEDEIGPGSAMEISGVPVGTDMDRFRAKARQFLKANQSHTAIIKLYRNEPLTATDVRELERIFIEAGLGSAEELESISTGGGLGLFVRSLIGLDRAAAKLAFDSFISGRRLSSHQLEFVDMMIDHLTARGAMDPRLLYESPFTDLDPMGVEGIFGESDVEQIIQILRDVQGRAAA
jgi:type I restriction enzyme R subunit